MIDEKGDTELIIEKNLCQYPCKSVYSTKG